MAYAAIYHGRNKQCNVVCEDIKSLTPQGSRYIELSGVETTVNMFQEANVKQLKNKKVPVKIAKRLSRRIDQSAVIA